MNRLFAIIVALFVTSELWAQNNQMVITEDFDNGAQLEWIEWTHKKLKAHALVENGCLNLRGCDIYKGGVYTGVDIKTINPNLDFNVKITLIIPKLVKNGIWGIAYNPYKTENGEVVQKAFVFNAGKCAFIREVRYDVSEYKKQKFYSMWPIPGKNMHNLRLASGSNVTVEIEMARKGTEIYFYVNGVEAAVVEAENTGYFEKPREYLTLCFTTLTEMKIDKIVITQDIQENK